MSFRHSDVHLFLKVLNIYLTKKQEVPKSEFVFYLLVMGWFQLGINFEFLLPFSLANNKYGFFQLVMGCFKLRIYFELHLLFSGYEPSHFSFSWSWDVSNSEFWVHSSFLIDCFISFVHRKDKLGILIDQ
jgi:hypothetical protein